jgi:hypothetical protein
MPGIRSCPEIETAIPSLSHESDPIFDWQSSGKTIAFIGFAAEAVVVQKNKNSARSAAILRNLLSPPNYGYHAGEQPATAVRRGIF